MSVFNRNDKPADAGATTAASTPPSPAPVARATAEPLKVPESKPVQTQAISQPIASVSPSAQHGRGVSVISKALKITGQLESTEDIQIASGAFIDGHLKPEYGKTAAKTIRAAE